MAKTLAIYGESGSWKTTALFHAACYLYKKYKKKIRMITAEEWNPPFGSLVEAGIVDLIEFNPNVGKGEPLSTLVKLSRGWWPNTARDTMLPLGHAENDIKNVCAYFVEGLTSISDVLLSDDCAKGRKHSEDIVGKFTEGGLNFGSPSRSSYGFVQRHFLDRFGDFRALPVERVIFTAHESKGEDEDTKDPIRGAGLAGKAATDAVNRKVGGMIHFEVYSEETIDARKISTVTNKVKAFFVTHPDKKFANVKYKCKPRIDSLLWPELMKRYPGGYFEPTIEHGLDKYLEAEDQIEAQAIEMRRKWKEEVLLGQPQ